MHRLVLFSALCAVISWKPPAASGGDVTVRFVGGRWLQTVTGTENVPAAARLRVNAHGPVTVNSDPSASNSISYSVEVSLKARSEADARRALRGYSLDVSQRGGWVIISVPRGTGIPSMTLQLPRSLREAVITTSDGAVNVSVANCPLRVDSGAGLIKVGRAAGDCKLVTGGGEIQVGSVGGILSAITGGGPITVKAVRGEAMLETAGGDITADEVAAIVRASTSGGAVRIGKAGGSVVATTGGGPIVVNRAGGLVTARNAAGPVQVGAAAGVSCETGTGAIRLDNISGAMRASTAMGSIMAYLMAGKLAESFLTTGNGDITIVIPSNLGVTIRAENEMSDTIRRIVSEFPGIPVRVQGTQVVAEGAINGGGPLLRISGTGGTIFIKRQQ